MKKRIISCILAVAVSVALCVCSSAQTSSKEESTKQSTEESTKESTEEIKTSDEKKANDLPIGSIEEDGYYNSYFGFKFIVPEENQDGMSNVMSIWYTAQQNDDNVELSSINTEDQESVENLINGYLDSNGAACVYTNADQTMTVGDENIRVTVYVYKLNGKSLDELLEQRKSQVNAEQSTVDFAGESRECLTYDGGDTMRLDGSAGKVMTGIYCVKDDYACEVSLSNYNSLENVVKAFDVF